MLVYRVEHKRYRNGPYVKSCMGNEECRVLSRRLCNESGITNHPPPSVDGILVECDDYCGFESLEQLFVWFRQWVRQLINCGYHISVFEIPREEIKFGGSQVTFKRKQHRRKQALSLETL
jgi:hypothetical protein